MRQRPRRGRSLTRLRNVTHAILIVPGKCLPLWIIVIREKGERKETGGGTVVSETERRASNWKRQFS